MKFWDDLLQNTSYAWNHWGLRRLSIGIIKNIADTVYYLGTQLLAVPHSVSDMISKDPVKRVVSHMRAILYENVLPILLVDTGKNIIQHYTDPSHSTQNNAMLSGFAFQSAKFLVFSGIHVFLFYKKRDMELRQLVVSFEVARHFPSMKNQSLKAICQDNHCTIKRHMGGIARQVLVRSGVNLSLDQLATFPHARIPSEIIKIQHDSTYILGQILPLCDRHLTEYLKKNPGLVWSTGILNFLLTLSTTLTLGSVASIPLSLLAGRLGYDKALGSALAFMIAHHLITVSKPGLRLLTAYITSNIALPDPQENVDEQDLNPLRYINPLLWYSIALGFCIDSIAIGLKTTLPKLFPENKKPIQLNKVVDDTRHVIQHPLLYGKYPWILFPEKYQSIEHLIRHDIVFRENWEMVREIALDYMDACEKIRKKFKGVIDIASLMPNIPAGAAWLLKGVSREVSVLIIKVISNHKVYLLFTDLRRYVGGLHTHEVNFELPENFKISTPLPEQLPELSDDDKTDFKVNPFLLTKPTRYFQNETNSMKIVPWTSEKKTPTGDNHHESQSHEQPEIIEHQSILPLHVPLNEKENAKEDIKEDSRKNLVIGSPNPIKLSKNRLSSFNTILKNEKSEDCLKNDDSFISDEQLVSMMMKKENQKRMMN